MATATLSDTPATSDELEDYVAALFQASGHFVETKVVEKEETEVLELDAVATSYGAEKPEPILVEAKSGGWGYPDVFKLLGWMTYLGLPRGAFFASKEIKDKNPELVAQRMSPHGVTVVHLGDFSQAIAEFEKAGLGKVSDPFMLSVWRFSFAMKRRLVEKLRKMKKSQPELEAPRDALEYHELTNDRIFFIGDPLVQLRELYDAYQAHPKLSLGACAEIDGKPYDCHDPPTESQAMRRALFNADHLIAQICFFLEHRARLAIMKAAVDYALKGGGPWLMYAVLPHSFQEALEKLRLEPCFRLYPLFWQNFLWAFGGFYLMDRSETEFVWLAEQVGMPVSEVPRALAAYDAMFPTTGGWLASAGASQCKIVKMFPAPFRGLGAWQRKVRYDADKYWNLGYSDHTATDLGKWNDAAVKVLA